jgi:hypothetical protein
MQISTSQRADLRIIAGLVVFIAAVVIYRIVS